LAAKDDMETGAATGGVNASSQSKAGIRDLMSRLDTNADGSISASESAGDATIKFNFATIDANSDGIVTSAEYRAWVKAERK
jgi:Ca2+-binding EF-hand superfamily protein